MSDRIVPVRCGRIVLALLVFLTWGGRRLPLASGAELTLVKAARPSVSMNFMHLQLAHKVGLDRREGFKVSLIQMRTAATIAALISGDVDYALSFESTVNAALQGAPVIAIGVTQDKPPFVIIARPEIKSFADLRGKILGQADVVSSAAYVLREVLRANGLKEGDYHLITAGREPDRLAGLLAGRIQATLFSPPYYVKALEAGMRSLGFAGDYTKSPNGVGTSLKKLRENRAQVKRFLKLLLETNHWMKSHPAGTIAFIKEEYKVDQKTAAESYDLFASTLSENGRIDDSYIQQIIDRWRKQSGAPAAVPLDRVRDFSVMKEAAEELNAH